MSVCHHDTFVLVPYEAKLRCRVCHLVLSKGELGDSYCPECFESRGERNDDFEELPDPSGGEARYVCESCGTRVGSG